MAKVKLDNDLYNRAREHAEQAGYSSLDEFVAHCIEQALSQAGGNEVDKDVADRLKGLGYID